MEINLPYNAGSERDTLRADTVKRILTVAMVVANLKMAAV